MTSPTARRTGISTQVTLKPSAALIPTAAILLIAAFFAAHQAWSTGFFLQAFTPVQAGLFYASLLYGIVITNTGLVKIRDDRVLIMDIIGGVLWTITTFWLYVTFPFDFTHFAAVVPWPLTYFVSWITQGIAKTIWFLITVGSAAFIPFFALQLLSARRKLRLRQ